MASTYRQQFLSLMRDNERAMTALFRDLHARIMGHVDRAATGEDGTIPLHESQAVRNRVSQEVLTTFQGPSGPYTTALGRVMPASPFMTVLWPSIEEATRLAVAEHAGIMRRKLKSAPDVLRHLESRRLNPLVVTRQVEEQTVPRRPFLDYDPAHRFVDPRGYRLSDRIWDTSAITRRKVDQLLAEMIAEGRGARDIAREFEQFLLPGRKLKRTNKPYGTNGSYDAMRLTRTEIPAAHSRAQRMAASMNPFVEEYDIVLSRSHPERDICDDAVDGGPYRWDDPSAPHVPLHPHCLCNERNVVIGATSDLIETLRAEIQPSRDALAGARVPVAPQRQQMRIVDFITPLLIVQFTRMLLDEPELQSEELY
ncbi:MAG: hypothetical protein ACYTBJ_14900 [Planctomycetota bacterium]|jgi:hypothetical protein